MTADQGIRWPHQSLRQAWTSTDIYQLGATEPWVQQVVADLLVAKESRIVLELGCYMGLTTAWLALALESIGGGTLIGVEIEEERARATEERLADLPIPHVHWTIQQQDSLTALRQLSPGTIDFAWIDDDHTPKHVAQELEWLCRPTMRLERRMKAGGLICLHDVKGPLGLEGVCVGYHGYTLDFPKIGVAGGLGLIAIA